MLLLRLGLPGLLLFLTTISHAQTSEKGNWSDTDIEKAKDAIAQVRDDLVELLGEEDTENYIDCYLQKIMDYFPDFPTADSSKEECEIMATDCMETIIEEMTHDGEPGNWSETDIALANSAMESVREDVEAVFGDKTKEYYECYLNKIMSHYPSFSAADMDEEGCTALATECAEEILSE